MKLVAGMKVRMTGNRGNVYTLVSKAPRSSKWVCSYATKGPYPTGEVRISTLELHRDFETL